MPEGNKREKKTTGKKINVLVALLDINLPKDSLLCLAWLAISQLEKQFRCAIKR